MCPLVPNPLAGLHLSRTRMARPLRGWGGAGGQFRGLGWEALRSALHGLTKSWDLNIKSEWTRNRCDSAQTAFDPMNLTGAVETYRDLLELASAARLNRKISLANSHQYRIKDSYFIHYFFTYITSNTSIPCRNSEIIAILDQGYAYALQASRPT